MRKIVKIIFCLVLVMLPMLLTVSCTDMPTAGLVTLSNPETYI